MLAFRASGVVASAALQTFVSQPYGWLSTGFPGISDCLQDKFEDVDVVALMPPVGEMFETVRTWFTLLAALALTWMASRRVRPCS